MFRKNLTKINASPQTYLILTLIILSHLSNSVVAANKINGTSKDKTETLSKNLKLTQSTSQPRNIIFILTDDHRYDYLGFTGKIPWLKTPNLDKLAENGAYFSNAFVSTSLCSPSRASILTGLYAHTHKIVDNQAPDPGNLTYFPQFLQKAGYQTAFFGKWHMGDHSDARKPGFNHWESFKGQGVYYAPQLNINGKHVQYDKDTYITDLLTDHAIAWLKNRNKEKPFFLYLSHKAAHADFMPAKRHRGLYKNKKLPRPASFTQTSNDEYKKLKWPQWVKDQRYSWHGVDFMYHGKLKQDLDEQVQLYCETLMGVDDNIGKLAKYLQEANMLESTLFIYMGDNGFSWGEHGLIDKRHFYEESAKVPLLVQCPELFKGSAKPKAMIQNVDIAPSILAAAGLEKPNYMPGKNFLPLLTGDKNYSPRQNVFYEYYWEYDFPMTPSTFGVRTDKYKYIRYHGIWDRNELYDLENDPDEIHNLIAEADKQETVKALLSKLYDWLENNDGLQIPLKRTIKYRFGDWKHQKEY